MQKPGSIAEVYKAEQVYYYPQGQSRKVALPRIA